MKGWKTKTAAVLAVVYGIGGAYFGLHTWDMAAQYVINGLGLVGIGHKIEKAGV